MTGSCETQCEKCQTACEGHCMTVEEVGW